MSNKTYTLTVYMALPGTPVLKGNEVEYSLPGHAYYAVSDGVNKQGFGFAPTGTNILQRMNGPGAVQPNEYQKYQNPYYERTMEITEKQYQALLDFGRKPQEVAGFNKDYYNFATNSCVDFVFGALKHAQIYQGRQTAIDDGLGTKVPYTDRNYEGELKIRTSIEELKRIPDPVPGSRHNDTIYRKAPKQNLLQWMVGENEQEQPHQYAQAAPTFRLETMPQAVQKLYHATETHLTEYHQKNGLAIDADKLQNSAMALASLGYSKKMNDAPLFNVKDGAYLIGELNPFLIRASMDMNQAASTPIWESVNRVQQTETRFEQEREMQLTQSQSRGMVMS